MYFGESINLTIMTENDFNDIHDRKIISFKLILIKPTNLLVKLDFSGKIGFQINAHHKIG